MLPHVASAVPRYDRCTNAAETRRHAMMRIGISCCIGAVLAASACSHSSSAPPQTATAQTTITSAPAASSVSDRPVVSSDEAVMRLTNARCDREVACNNVGSERLFVDRDACARQLGRDAYVNLEPRVCPGGIDDAKLATCLADVRNE